MTKKPHRVCPPRQGYSIQKPAEFIYLHPLEPDYGLSKLDRWRLERALRKLSAEPELPTLPSKIVVTPIATGPLDSVATIDSYDDFVAVYGDLNDK